MSRSVRMVHVYAVSGGLEVSTKKNRQRWPVSQSLPVSKYDQS
jgi:hypothetical protein